MSETSTGQAVPDVADRGRLEIADRVVETIATHAASSVTGVVPSGSAFGKVVGQRLPKASSQVRGEYARVSVDIAVAWPHPLSAVAQQVRAAVSSQIHQIAGLNLSAVDVTVARVEVATAPPARRVQ